MAAVITVSDPPAPTILVVDDDAGTIDSFQLILSLSGFNVLTANCGAGALQYAEQRDVSVVLSDLRLPDMTGIDVLRKFRAVVNDASFVIMTAFGSASSAVEALRLGACNYVEKPLIGDDLVRVIYDALAARSVASPPMDLPEADAHALARWADTVVRVVDCAHDPKTIEGWAHCAASSPGAIRNWCRTACLSPKGSLDFARLLRAVVRHQLNGERPENLLDASDRRTLSRLLKLGATTGRPVMTLPFTIESFLTLQRWIVDPRALHEIRRHLELFRQTRIHM